jgi:hypothetical protein
VAVAVLRPVSPIARCSGPLVKERERGTAHQLGSGCLLHLHVDFLFLLVLKFLSRSFLACIAMEDYIINFTKMQIVAI